MTALRLLGLSLSGSGLKFISANFTHKGALSGQLSTGIVVCETQEQCDAIAAWAKREDWVITTRVATAEETADAKYWSER